jgi:hypothetical protein
MKSPDFSGQGFNVALTRNRVGAIETTSSAAIVQLKGRVTRGCISSRLSEAPNNAQTPLQGIAIKPQSAAIKRTLKV